MDGTGETLGALVGQGRTAEVFEWGRRHVVKLFREGFQTQAARESEAAQLAYGLGCPTPELNGRVEVGGRQGLIFERVNGPSLMRLLSSKPWRLRWGAHTLAQLQSAVHQCTAPSLPPLVAQLRTLIERAQGLTLRQRTAALDVLEQMPDGERLCHGDMHPGNVLEGATGAVVIDWGTAGRGDPLVDVGLTGLIMRLGALPPGTPWLLRQLVPVMRERLRQDYFLGCGLSADDRQHLQSWQVAFAAARLGRGVDAERHGLLQIISEAVAP